MGLNETISYHIVSIASELGDNTTRSPGRCETVLTLDESTGTRHILDDSNAPVRSIVVGIVDAVEFESS